MWYKSTFTDEALVGSFYPHVWFSMIFHQDLLSHVRINTFKAMIHIMTLWMDFLSIFQHTFRSGAFSQNPALKTSIFHRVSWAFRSSFQLIFLWCLHLDWALGTFNFPSKCLGSNTRNVTDVKKYRLAYLSFLLEYGREVSTAGFLKLKKGCYFSKQGVHFTGVRCMRTMLDLMSQQQGLLF